MADMGVDGATDVAGVTAAGVVAAGMVATVIAVDTVVAATDITVGTPVTATADALVMAEFTPATVADALDTVVEHRVTDLIAAIPVAAMVVVGLAAGSAAAIPAVDSVVVVATLVDSVAAAATWVVAAAMAAAVTGKFYLRTIRRKGRALARPFSFFAGTLDPAICLPAGSEYLQFAPPHQDGPEFWLSQT